MSDLSTATAATEYMQKTKTRVRAFTQSGVVEGDYAHAPGVRISDSLRNAASGERYMLLTDVTISPVGGGEATRASESAPFILLSTSHISIIIPMGEE